MTAYEELVEILIGPRYNSVPFCLELCEFIDIGRMLGYEALVLCIPVINPLVLPQFYIISGFHSVVDYF